MNEIQILRDFLAILPRSQRPRLALLAVGLVVTGLLEMTGLGIIFVYISLLNDVGGASASGGTLSQIVAWLGLTSTTDVALWLGLALIGIFIAKGATIIGVYALLMRFTFENFRLVGEQLFRAFLDAPYEYHLSKNSADAQRIINNEVPAAFNSVGVSFVFLVANVVTASLMCAALLIIEPLATLLAVVLLGGVTGTFYALFRRRIDQLGMRRHKHVSGTIKWVNQALGGMREIRVFGREAYFMDSFHKHIGGVAESDRGLRVLGQVPSQINELILVIGIVGIIVAFIAAGRPLPTLLPTLAMFGVAGVRISGMVASMVGQLQAIQFNGPAVSNIRRALNDAAKWQAEAAAASASNAPVAATGDIVLRNVSYSYPSMQSGALKNLSLTIKPGSRVAFVGPSGAGKSTLIAMLLGLLPPTQGELRVGDRPLVTRDWHRTLAFVPQSIFLMDDTIRANVLFGLPPDSVSEQQLWQAVEAAQLGKVVRAHDLGLDVHVGENGIALSGGERQRVGIARALLKRPSVLVLDEATASLDAITERRLTQAVMDLGTGITLIVVAHRLSTVRNCDVIHYLEDGRLVDSGTYDELLRSCASFRKMASSTPDDAEIPALAVEAGGAEA